MATVTATLSISIQQEDLTTITPEQFVFSLTSGSSFTVKEEKNVDVGNGTDTRLLTMGTDESGGQETAKLAIVQNLDTAETMRLKWCDTSGETAWTNILPLGMHVFTSDQLETHATEGAFSAFAEVDTVYAQFTGTTGKARVLSIGV